MHTLGSMVMGAALFFAPFSQAPAAAQELDLKRALETMREAVDERWSYRSASDADFDMAFEALSKRVDEGLDESSFGIELQRIVSLGIDGHAQIDGVELGSREFLPFLVEPCGDRFVAFLPDRTAFVAKGKPYVTRIDGRPLEEWLSVAGEFAPRGSPQYVRRQALRTLRELGYLRSRLGLPVSGRVKVELTDARRRETKVVELDVRERPPSYGTWPRRPSGVMNGNVGYLRLTDMDARDSVREIETWMPRFADTIGLVVDVRDNGGGARDALLRLHALFARPDSSPVVVNCAAYRLHRSRDRDHLSRRFMYRAEDERWTEAERKAIATFAAGFQPKWSPPEGDFSEWHYLVLSPSPSAAHYKKPVIVLSNAKCFSATDIFLAGMKEIESVTVVGEPSGGGSALVEKHRLRGSRFEAVLGSMVSFQVDGNLFDGQGVLPDVRVDPTPDYFIGGEDAVLEFALKRLRAAK